MPLSLPLQHRVPSCALGSGNQSDEAPSPLRAASLPGRGRPTQMIPTATALLVLAIISALVGSTEVAWRAACLAAAFYGATFLWFLLGVFAGRRVHL